METNDRLARVQAELARYEHPLFDFAARPKGEAVEVLIACKVHSLGLPTYVCEFHPRDVDHPQFSWTFQRQFYDNLHDCVVKMFTRNPQGK